jgi:hypothetical protein
LPAAASASAAVSTPRRPLAAGPRASAVITCSRAHGCARISAAPGLAEELARQASSTADTSAGDGRCDEYRCRSTYASCPRASAATGSCCARHAIRQLPIDEPMACSGRARGA